MGKFFGKANNVQLSEHEILKNKYNSARSNLIVAVLFTVVNIVLAFFDASSYFLFSIFVPYILTFVGMLLTGKLPADYYTDEWAELEFFPNSVFAVALGIAAVILALYVLSYIFSSKNRVGWLIFALVIFGIDTALMLLLQGISADSLFDIIFHAWIIISLVNGITSHFKLKNLPEEELIEQTAQPDSVALRIADLDVKAKMLAEAEHDGFSIQYRRVKKVNELVVNGNVYDQYEALLEQSHNLVAVIGGRTIEAGYDGFRSYIKIDGEIIVKKTRLV